MAIISLLDEKDEKSLFLLSRGKDLKEGKGFEKLLMIRSDETPRAFGGRSQGWLTKQC